MNNSIDNLYKKSSSETTPKALDDLILNAAKQSCEPKAKAKSRTWMMPFATAAVFVMGLSMIINLQDTQSELQIPEFNDSDDAIEIEFLPEEQVEAYSKQENRKARIVNAKPKKTALKKQLSTPKFNTEPQAIDRITAEEIQLEIAPIQAPAINSVEKPETVSNLVRREKQATTPAKKDLKEKKTDHTFGYSRNKDEEKEKGLVGKPTNQADEEKVRVSRELNNPENPPTVVDKLTTESGSLTTSTLGSVSTSNYKEEPVAEVDEEERDSVITTGNAVQATKIGLSKDIKQLEELILNKHFTEAKNLLKILKTKYPDYDFSVYSNQLLHD